VQKDLISVTEIARDFLLKSGNIFSQLEKTEFDEGKKQWILTYNVGLSAQKLQKVVIDDATGKVLSFEPARA
jgi:hypothetical protein